jgi:acyl carrier protein
MNILEIIEQEVGVKVTLETPVEELPVDSLEYLSLMVAAGVDSRKTYATVGDIAKDMA